MKPIADIETMAKWLHKQFGLKSPWKHVRQDRYLKVAAKLLTNPPEVLLNAIRVKELA